MNAEEVNTDVEAFSFGDPEAVLDGHSMMDSLGIWLMDNGRYYSTPVSMLGLAKLLRLTPTMGRFWSLKRIWLCAALTATHCCRVEI
ncbi:hypothetical protein MKHDV_02602 [Halodesulfovibrio sp. MK-HDV]|nr:hypothetical protein MKHDV_02602 [Halodesulfovibrio sp. MK-HDV]